ncbi:unnamed protein product [Orchesella dallaii]|uniref:PHD-type domain-containing protein n=2 Tax=Orchesella dallaii TaxID=48710 RepID=A0ABP1RY25_9HEXA
MSTMKLRPNMQKGARTKASMKKLMQEQQITTPNGQATETSSETSQISAKDSDSLEATVEPVPKPETKTKGRSPARKKKSAAALSPAIPTDPFVSQSSVIVSDLTTGAVSAIPVARPGYTKSGKKIGRPRKDASSANVPSETKPKSSKGSKSPKKTKASTTPQFSEPMQVPESELATALSETVASLEETVIPIIEEPNNAVVKADRPSKLKAAKTNPRKRSSKVLNDTGDEHEEQEESSQVSTTVATVDLNIPPLIIKSSQISPVINEFTPTSIPLGGKRRKQSKPNFTIVQPDVNLSLSAPESSEISQQEAESVATRVAQSLPSPPKAKGRRRKSTNSTKESRKRKSLKQKAAITQPKVISVKEIDTSPERRDLPRLRSRSPKQGESPPLRISSPRAAKERSSTPASTTSQASPQRPRASKEKDTSRGAITPLSSPTLRSPKKESPRGKVGGRKGKQKVEENVVVEEPQDNLLLSPPPAKRLRQMSKESTDSEIQGRRRTSVVETRLSIESEKSRPLAGKRSSRRKSGSVSGSIDNALSSPTPSLNQSNSSLNMQSEISLEVTAPSSSLDSSFEIKSDVAEISTQEESTSTALNNVVDLPPRRKGKGKGKRATKKPRSRLKKLRASTEIVEGVVFTEDEPALEDVIVVLPESQEETPTSPTPVTPPVSPTVKSKKQKKTTVKKGKKAVLLVTENVPFQDIPEPSVDAPTVIEVQVPVVPKQQRKRKSSAKTAKATVPIQPPVLNIPEFTPPKKEVKVKPRLRKGSKQGKKSSKKGGAQKLESLVLVSPPIVPPPETEPPLIEEPISNAQPTFSQPQDLSPSRRRRPSVVSPNTQTSAKSSSSSGMESPSKVKSETTGVGTPASPTKSQRRDSRSVSRDYDVSVVLTDIAQSLSSGDYSFANISNTFTRQSLQSPPSNSQPLISPPIPIEPAVSPLKVETCSGNSDELDVKGKIPKKKRQSKPNSIPNSELLERKATLEAEVAQVLLEMKSGNSSSSKSPSPAKSIPIVEVNDETITTITPRKKQTKQRKRKNSTTPRRSKASVKQEISAELDSSLSPIAATPGLVAPLNHTRKRKMMKMNAKPASKAKLKAKSLASTLPVLSSTPIVGNTANVDKDGFIGTSIALTPVAPVTTVKVSKTASIPTASSFDMSATTPVYAVKSKPELKQKAKNLTRKRKERTKIAKSSPDITAFSTSKSSATPITPTIEPITKRRRKKAGKSEETADGEAKNVKSQVSSLIGPGMEADVSASSPDAPLKKKRQRKRKGESDAATASSSIAVDSANDPATTSKLFPYQTQPKEMKKPTVFSKRTPFVEDKVRKYEDNQKKKPNEGPSLRVIGGLAKFYRGGEEEQVDQDPKLPKEKAPLQTDNAVPWLCSFCHMGPHAQKLGDLFGPYFANLPSIYGNPSPKRETWMHGDCALWAGRLQMIGTHLRNLEVTLSNADKETCTVCGKTGATMGCLRRHCKQAVHYPCAIRRFWKIDAAIFHSYCPEHIP